MHPVRNLHNKKIDVGRLIIIPIFIFLMIVHTLVIYENLRTPFPISTIKAVALTHHLLLGCFYTLVILLYLIRTSAISTSRSFITNTIAVVATFTPFALAFLGRPAFNKPEIVLVADLIIIFGMALSIYSLSALGRSFSIIPQTRKLIQSGPYRLVRHPLYLGELISVFGIVLAGITIPKITIFFLLVGSQVYRALQEEKLLTDVFPEYKKYRLKTSRFIPGIL